MTRKRARLELVKAGYEPPVMRNDIPAPGESMLAALNSAFTSCAKVTTSLNMK